MLHRCWRLSSPCTPSGAIVPAHGSYTWGLHQCPPNRNWGLAKEMTCWRKLRSQLVLLAFLGLLGCSKSWEDCSMQHPKEPVWNHPYLTILKDWSFFGSLHTFAKIFQASLIFQRCRSGPVTCIRFWKPQAINLQPKLQGVRPSAPPLWTRLWASGRNKTQNDTQDVVNLHSQNPMQSRKFC